MSSSGIGQELAVPDPTCVQTGNLGCDDWSHALDGLASSHVETILLVEDESFVREVTREVLHSAGYRVLSARNAFDAANIAESIEFHLDLLLTDVILPGENGRFLGAKLRMRNPKLKILYITGYAEQMGGMGMGGDCLAKPFSTDILLRRVREILDGGESREQTGCNFKLACGDA